MSAAALYDHTPPPPSSNHPTSNSSSIAFLNAATSHQASSSSHSPMHHSQHPTHPSLLHHSSLSSTNGSIHAQQPLTSMGEAAAIQRSVDSFGGMPAMMYSSGGSLGAGGVLGQQASPMSRLDNQGGLTPIPSTMNAPYGSALMGVTNPSLADTSPHSSTSSSRTRLASIGAASVNMGQNDSGISSALGVDDLATLSSSSMLLIAGPSPGGGGLFGPSGSQTPTTAMMHGHHGAGPSGQGATIHNHAGFGTPELCAASGCQFVGGAGMDPQMMGGGQMELEELEPMARDRCNTWPLRRPTLELNNQTSPLIHDRIPEEEGYDEFNEEDEINALNAGADAFGGGVDGMDGGKQGGGRMSDEVASPTDEYGGGSGDISPIRSDSALGGDDGTPGSPQVIAKKSTTRRNAWGNMSYADLITQAILNSPEKRLTLSQVYDWMVQNVPYFRDKGDSNSSAGWKNSIRHNLSLHSRFMRIQNEGAGKSSWWVLNPDAKPGRNPRRRAATMENATKAAIDKKRRGARKRVELGAGRGGALQSASTSMMGSQASLTAQEVGGGGLYGGMDSTEAGDGPLGPTGAGNFETFRQRTQSMLSNAGPSSRMSPTLEPPGFEDFEFPSWMDTMASGGGGGRPLQPVNANQPPQQQQQVNDILDRTDQMRIIEAAAVSVGNAYHKTSTELINGGVGPALNGIRGGGDPRRPSQPNVLIKSEPMEQGGMKVQPPPSYQELKPQVTFASRAGVPVSGIAQQQQGMGAAGKMPPQYISQQAGQAFQPTGHVQLVGRVPTVVATSGGWMPGSQPGLIYSQQQGGGAVLIPGQPMGPTGEAPLPHDLENLTLAPDQSLMDFDVEAVLRHDLSLSRDNKLHFDL